MKNKTFNIFYTLILCLIKTLAHYHKPAMFSVSDLSFISIFTINVSFYQLVTRISEHWAEQTGMLL